ncbi:MAG: hypothetical protein JXR88_18500 [Clostridia bacterium]|nr:hypothetical protein [Clostridia bacterium]
MIFFILLTHNVSEYNKSCTNDVIYEKVKYSHVYLIEQSKLVMEHCEELNVESVAVLDSKNKLVIKYIEEGKNLEKELNKLIPNDIYILSEITDTERYVSQSTLVNGTGFVSDGGGYTIGFAARLNGEPGFVSSAHGVDSDSANAYIGINKIGDLRLKQFLNDVDASFYLVHWNDDVSKLLSNGGSYHAVSSSFIVEGQYVIQHGAKTGKATGYITYTSQAGYIDDTLITDMIITSADTQEGDSGGPLTCYVGGTTAYNNVIGILNGSNSGGSAYTKATNIMIKLGLTEY